MHRHTRLICSDSQHHMCSFSVPATAGPIPALLSSTCARTGEVPLPAASCQALCVWLPSLRTYYVRIYVFTDSLARVAQACGSDSPRA